LLLPFMPTKDSFWLDEGDTAMYAIQPDFSSWWQHLNHDENADCQMPLSMFCAWAGGQTLGTQEWQIRAINLLWGTLALIGMFRVGRQLQLHWLPLLLAIQPYFWFYMNQARPYALEIACGTWLLAAFVEFNLQKASGETWAWLLGITTFFLSLSTMLAPVPVAAVVIAGGVIALKNRWHPGRRAVLILFGSMIANIPVGIYYAHTLFRGAKAAALWHVDMKFFGFVVYELTGMTGLGLPTDEIRSMARSPHFAHSLASHWPEFIFPALGLILILTVIVLGLRRRFRSAGISAGIIITLGLTALVFISGSLFLQKAFWARHFAPVFPFYVALLGLGLAASTGSSRAVIRWLTFLLIGLLFWSCLDFRLATKWRNEDYRSAAQYARLSLMQNKSVWWLASEDCAIYYHLQIAQTNPEPGKIYCPTLLPTVLLNPLEKVPPADVIIFSKPDIFDNHGSVQRIIERDHYTVATRLKSFVMWEKSSSPPQTDVN
jgi:hypothetical protein